MASDASGGHSDSSFGSLHQDDEMMPKRIDRYEPLRKLATGGMAELFLAKQSGMEGFEKLVVIKRILSHLAQDDVFVNMFLDEARIAAKLSHANIVQIYDLGKAEDSYYIAMEYVSGRNVQHLISKEAEENQFIPIEYTCRIVAGVCEGLHYAHTRRDYDRRPLNIVHRDISPQNILVSFAGGVKVVDFGIAKAATQVAQTRAGVLKGKYAYMSPEQVRGAKQIDHRSDIFSAGLVMYEMLTGRRAFERDSSMKTLKAIVQEKPLNPTELNPEIPTAVIKLLSRALEKNPDRRYKNSQEMQLAIEDYLEKSPKKANTVRLSRYMFELFDEDIKTEGGTMVVEGIGEVIIPTGQGDKVKAEHEDSVPQKKISKELEADSKSVSPTLELGQHLEDSLADETGQEDDSEAEKPTKLQLPKIKDEDLDDDYEEEDEDDKTIPVYDLEDYERIRGKKLGATEEKKGGVIARDYDSPSAFDSDAPTVGIPAVNSADLILTGPVSNKKADDTATEEIDPATVQKAKNKAVQKGPPKQELVSVDEEAPTINFDPKAHDIDIAKLDKQIKSSMASDQATVTPKNSMASEQPTVVPKVAASSTGPLPSLEQAANWGDGEDGTETDTASLDKKAAPPEPREALYSQEAVVGSDGVIRGIGDSGIRPAAAPMTRQSGAKPKPVAESFARQPLNGQVSGDASDSAAGHGKNKVASDWADGLLLSAKGRGKNFQGPGANSSRAIAVLIALTVVILLVAIVMVAYAYIVLPNDSSVLMNEQRDYVQVDLRSEPSGAQVLINGKPKGVTPLNIFVQTGENKLVFEKAGFESLQEKLQLSAGESVKKTIQMKRKPEASPKKE